MSQFFKNRVIITISDIKGTKSYSLSKLVRKFIFWIVVSIISIAVVGAIIIPVLTQKIMSLASQNEVYQRDLNSKIMAYDRLDDKFELLQERIIAYEESSNLPERKPETCSKDGKPSKEKSVDMGTEIKNFILKHIPNGYIPYGISKFHRALGIGFIRFLERVSCTEGLILELPLGHRCIRLPMELSRGSFGAMMGDMEKLSLFDINMVLKPLLPI